LLEKAGLQNVRSLPMTFGVATLYIGKKKLDVVRNEASK